MAKKTPEVVQIEQQIKREGENAELNQKLERAKLDSRYFNFPTMRRFWYNAGKPITMIFFGIVLMYILPSVIDKNAKTITLMISLLLIGIGSYFLIWCIWIKKDFPTTLYYYGIIIMSIISPFLAYYLINYKKGLRTIIRNLFDFIIIDINDKFISEDQKRDYVRSYQNQIKKAIDGQ